MVTTRKTNANAHPGRVVLENQQSRRGKQQIEDDNAIAEEVAHVREEEAAAKYRAMVERIAQLEDAIAEKDPRAHAQRPDLRPRSPQAIELTQSASVSGGSLESFELRGGVDDGSNDASIVTGDFCDNDDDEGPGPGPCPTTPTQVPSHEALSHEDECDSNDEEIQKNVIPARCPTKKKEVSYFRVTYCGPGY